MEIEGELPNSLEDYDAFIGFSLVVGRPVTRTWKPDLPLVKAWTVHRDSVRRLGGPEVLDASFVDELSKIFLKHKIFPGQVEQGRAVWTKHLNSLQS